MSGVRVIITGATGYIGGVLCRALLAKGWPVAAVVMPGDPGELPHGVVRITDPGTAAELAPLLTEFQPEAVLHLAAVQELGDGPIASDALVAANLGFGARILAAAEASGARALVAASSYSVHADGDAGYAPQTLYAATKQAFSVLGEHYRRNTSLHVTSLELSDTYGPGDRRPKIMNLFAHAAVHGQPLEASPGEQILRPLHVDDIAEAFAHAARELASGSTLPAAVSVSGPDAVTLRGLASVFAEATGATLQIEWGARPYRTNEIMRPWDGPQLPGWGPQIALRDGLASVYGDLTEWKVDEA